MPEESKDVGWVPNEADLAEYIVSGRVSHLPEVRNKVVKIFLSSTFTGKLLLTSTD